MSSDEEHLPPILLGHRYSDEAQLAMQQGKLSEARIAHDNAKRAFKQAGDALAASNTAERETREALALLVEHHRLRARDLKQIIKQQQAAASPPQAPQAPQQKGSATNGPVGSNNNNNNNNNNKPSSSAVGKSSTSHNRHPSPAASTTTAFNAAASLSSSVSDLLLNNQTVKGAWREFSEMGNALISATAAQLQQQQQQLLQKTRSPSPPATSSSTSFSAGVRRAAAMSASVSGTASTTATRSVHASETTNSSQPPAILSIQGGSGANPMAQSYAGLGESFYIVPTDQQDNIGMFMRANAGAAGGGRDSLGALRTDNERLGREVEALREQLRREQDRARAQTRRFAAVFTALKLALEKADGRGGGGEATKTASVRGGAEGLFTPDGGGG